MTITSGPTVAVHHSESWEWLIQQPDESVDLVYIDPPFMTQRDHGSFDDRWRDRYQFVQFLVGRIVELRRMLKPTGNLILHLDYRTAHHVRCEVDRIFLRDPNNEIIWSYRSGGAGKRTLAKKHDTLLWWSKTDNYTFNIVREPYATPGVEDRKGFHPDGRMLTDNWDINFISTTSKERTGYPTQKPIALLRRVVEVFSNPDDTVLDCFCGSGTTGQAALELERNVILVDESEEAIQVTRKRLGQ